MPTAGRQFLGATHSRRPGLSLSPGIRNKCKLRNSGGLRVRGKIMSGRLSLLQLRASLPGEGPHSPGTEEGSLWCWLLPSPRPPGPRHGIPWRGGEGRRDGARLCLRGSAGCAHSRLRLQGLLTLVLVWRTQGHAPLRPGSPAQKRFRSSQSTHTVVFCWGLFFFIFHYERLDGVYSKLLIQRENRSR